MIKKRKGFTVKYKPTKLNADMERAICDEQIDYYSKKLYYLTEARHVAKARQHLDHWIRRRKALDK